MTKVPKVITGTYKGKPFELLDRAMYFEGTEYFKPIEGYVIEFVDGKKKYVLDNDPFLKFDQIRTEDGE